MSYIISSPVKSGSQTTMCRIYIKKLINSKCLLPNLSSWKRYSRVEILGDTLNIVLLYNKDFREACERVYSPRNAFCISRDDGMMNKSINLFKDIMINMNAMIGLGRHNYTQEQLDKISNFKKKYNIK